MAARFAARNRLTITIGSLLIPIISGCIVFILLYSTAPAQTPISEVAAAVTQPTPVQAAAPLPELKPPVRLAINTVNIDAPVKPTGLTADGDMAVEDSITDVAWYSLGFKPGQIGSAVIAGHYGWKAGQPSVFNPLQDLKPGDILTSYDSDGKAISFSVTATRIYRPDADAAEVFSSTDGIAHLNLITCEGTWDAATKSYTDRLVVFSDIIKTP